MTYTTLNYQGVYDMSIWQGSDFCLRLALQNDDSSPYILSGFNARGSLRYKFADTNIVLDLKPVINYPEFGYIDLNIPANNTTGISATRYLYDIEIYSLTTTERIIMGNASILSEVTY